MKDLRTISYFSAEQQSTDGIVSHMLMGFVERKISPQTIADVLRAQIFESQIPIHLLNTATCNGILETVTLASCTEECTDLVLYLSTHPEFPQSLSFKAAAGTLRVLLRYAQKRAENYKKLLESTKQKLNFEEFQEHDFFNNDFLRKEEYSDFESNFLKDVKRIDELIEDLSLCILNIFHSKLELIDYEVRENLAILIKSSHPIFTKLLRNSVHFQHLRFMLMTPDDDSHDSAFNGLLPKPYEMMLALLQTPEEQILKHGINYYKTEPSEKNSSDRIKYIQTVINLPEFDSFSEFKKTFLIEWLFEKSLYEAVLNEDTTFEYITVLKSVVENYVEKIYILRGLLKSIQKDYANIAYISPKKSTESVTLLLQKAHKLASTIFPALVNAAEKDLNYVAKNIANWVLELPIQHEDVRFFKKIHWRWIRTLSAKIWDASLREPPAWVVEGGNFYCATIFHAAPALWLQEYSVALIERVYHETLGDHFIPTGDHFNYVEYLIRSLRKKSPFFASRTESLYALHLLARMTRVEATQYANAHTRFQTLLPCYSSAQIQVSPEFSLWKQIIEQEDVLKNNLGNNPVTRALCILSKLALETAKKQIH